MYVSLDLTWLIYRPHRLPQMTTGACFESGSPMLVNDSRKRTDCVYRLRESSCESATALMRPFAGCKTKQPVSECHCHGVKH